jgi:hypothetical protein
MKTKNSPGVSATKEMQPGTTWTWKHLSVLVYLLPLIVLLAQHVAVFFESMTDENVHLYVAKRVAEGLVLYRDIHSARPPLVLAPLVLLFKLHVAPLLAARGTVVFAILCTALALRWYGGKLLGAATGLTAFALMLLAPETSVRTPFTGIQLVTLWSTLCALLVLLDRPFLAGLAGGLALATGQHALVIVGLSGVVIFLRCPRAFGRFVAGLGLTFGAIFAVLLAQGSAPWEDLFGRHLYHVNSGGTSTMAKGDQTDIGWYLSSFCIENLPLLILAAAALILSRSRREKFSDYVRDPLWTLALLVLAHVATVALMHGGLVLYLFPALPLIVLLASDGLVRAVRWACLSADNKRKATSQMLVGGLSLGAALLAVTLGAWGLTNDRYERRDKLSYPYIPHMRSIAMKKIQRLKVVDAIEKALVGQVSTEQTVFGYPPIAATVALRISRRIAAEQADLAPRWIQMGLVDWRDVINAIEQDHIRVFVTMKRVYMNEPSFRNYLFRCYDKPQRFPSTIGDGSGVPDIYLFRHRDGIHCRLNPADN